MIERRIDIATPDGAVGTFICHPERDGPHPLILFFMDAPGIREELRDMARRLATVGYYVMLPNLYYRAGVDELGDFVGEAGAPVRVAMMALADALTIAEVMADADALIAFADADPAASTAAIGCLGYCMSGRYAIAAAARHADRVTAAASIYGTHLVTDAADSPHRLIRAARAEYYVAFAEIDEYAPLAMAPPIRTAIADAASGSEVEIYPGVHHGFAFPGRPMYDKLAAERHWERLFALFARRLAPVAGLTDISVHDDDVR